MRISISILLFLAILNSCGNKNASIRENNRDTKSTKDTFIDTSTFINQKHGIGKIRIVFDNIGSIKKLAYSLYNQPTLTSEKKEMILKWNEAKNGYVEAVNDEILKIRDYHIDEPYYIILYDCLKEENGFYQIVINEETRETKWIKASDVIVFEPWSVFLKNVVCVSQLDTIQNPVRREPNQNSDIISNSDGCWDVESMEGMWIKVKYSEFDFDLTDPKIKEFQGWIKWRDNEKFLIQYFLAD